MRGSHFLQILTGYVLLTLAASALVLGLSVTLIRGHYRHTLAAGLANLDRALARQAGSLLVDGRQEAIQALARDIGAATAARITIIDRAGKVLGDSEEDPAHLDNHGSRPEVMKALSGGVGESTRVSASSGVEMLYVAAPIEAGGVIVGVVRASYHLRDTRALLGGLERRMGLLATVVVLVCLASALVLSRNLASPIRQIGAASRRVAAGDFEAKVLLKGSGELKRLSESFNLMTDRIRNLVGDLTHKQEELGGIISAIREGLMVVDSDGRITLSNESFARIAATGDVVGRFYWEVLRTPELGDLVRGAFAGATGAESEIRIREKTYACAATPVGLGREVVVLLHDITDIRNLEQIKRDFVVNMSHELRTPLTAIKGFLETLDLDNVEESRRHLEVIRRHTDRLVSIVEDLLRISELEDSRTRLSLETVDLGPLLEEVVASFEARAGSKGISLEIKKDAGPHMVMADPFKLEQVLINLIDNAVKYTERGSIGVSLGRDESGIKVAVADTGIGIPEEHLTRIFERFYVVDKSRSRRVGGTGLGLSIAKHIVLLHNGTIEVASAPGRGTTFSVVLPAAFTQN